MTTSDEEHLSISITGLKEWNIEDPKQLGRGLIIKTTRGDLRTIVHHDPNLPTTRGIIWVGGASGGFDGPANGLYKKMGEKLESMHLECSLFLVKNGKWNMEKHAC